MLDSDRRLQRKRVIFLGLPIEDEAPSLSRARDRRFGFRRRFVRFVDLHGVGNGRSSPEKDAHVAEEGGRAGGGTPAGRAKRKFTSSRRRGGKFPQAALTNTRLNWTMNLLMTTVQWHTDSACFT